ncbi:hypothetical protein V327_01403, partial [Staphylococcus aureus F29450_091412]
MIFLQNLFRCPTPTCTLLYADFPPASMLGPLTRVEKSLLQAHFHSVNYCQYNIIDPRT